MRPGFLDLLGNVRRRPDRTVALRRYQALAPGYDGTVTQAERLRAATIELLGLREGETVIDVACGSGLSFPGLVERVGPTGRVIGVDLCPHMARQARERVAAAGWRNVEVVNGPIEEAVIAHTADALLFCFTHDVLQSPPALAHLVAAASPRARVAITGLRTVPWWWGAPVNLWNLWRTSPYLTTFTNLRAPWRNLLTYCPNLAVARRYWFGSYYVAVGVLAAEREGRVSSGEGALSG